jgi:DNA processing protein
VISNELVYQIALTQVSGIGSKLAKSLIAYCGGVEAVFKENLRSLQKIPGIGPSTIRSLSSSQTFNRAEKELKFMDRNNVSALFYLNDDYPSRLKLCPDSPILLFKKGNFSFLNKNQIAIVGTRMATNYGKTFCSNFIADLKPYDVQVISGLAYGIDIAAHKEALKNDIETIAVLGHGLDRIYPSSHKKVVEEMIEKGGGLLTEFLTETNPDRENFPKRNRIVAGVSEAIIVVEAAKKGGALITAEIANTYNRDVFAIPGKLGDIYSEGCNHLIKINKAALFTGVNDLEYLLGWEKRKIERSQIILFPDLNPLEEKIRSFFLESKKKLELEEICNELDLPASQIVPTLLNLEIKGLVRSNPGKLFELTSY